MISLIICFGINGRAAKYCLSYGFQIGTGGGGGGTGVGMSGMSGMSSFIVVAY